MFNFEKVEKVATKSSLSNSTITISRSDSLYIGKALVSQMGLLNFLTADLFYDHEKNCMAVKFFQDNAGAYNLCFSKRKAITISMTQLVSQLEKKNQKVYGKYKFSKVQHQQLGQLLVINVATDYVGETKDKGVGFKQISLSECAN